MPALIIVDDCPTWSRRTLINLFWYQLVNLNAPQYLSKVGFLMATPHEDLRVLFKVLRQNYMGRLAASLVKTEIIKFLAWPKSTASLCLSWITIKNLVCLRTELDYRTSWSAHLLTCCMPSHWLKHTFMSNSDTSSKFSVDQSTLIVRFKG
ncbi:hypothetical protein CPB83DRAFT_859628 [Crepidotus variabilis]|uniref:Uncharacterized protein n=1 Tax=Crepidotus variabilis TaxID=179855 RepID=A0A9P6EA63_9AGAR|nr:hypothetical protein CPB83DRAFT_859628 [Crepidotus variabilis]